jgi:hypothetical protein
MVRYKILKAQSGRKWVNLRKILKKIKKLDLGSKRNSKENLRKQLWEIRKISDLPILRKNLLLEGRNQVWIIRLPIIKDLRGHKKQRTQGMPCLSTWMKRPILRWEEISRINLQKIPLNKRLLKLILSKVWIK